MKKITVKNKVILVSLTSLVYFLFAHQAFLIDIVKTNDLYIFISPLILSLLMLFGAFWLLNFRSGFKRYSVIIFYCFINIFAFSVFFELVLLNQTRLGQITITLLLSMLMFVIFYVHLLTTNIINYSHIKDIPLVYAARATAYIITLFSEYLIFLVTINSDVLPILKLGIILCVTFFHSYFLLDSIKQKLSNKIYSASAISLLVFVFSTILLVWPVTSEIKSIILTLIMYICIGISLEIKEKINKSIWVEYITLTFSIVFLLILLSNWGINGHLL